MAQKIFSAATLNYATKPIAAHYALENKECSN
jgi:hypothetical protein